MTMKTDPTFNGQIFRKDHYMIFASNRHMASIKAIKVQTAAEILPGQVMARDPGDGLFKKWSAVSGGSFDSVCVLMDHITENEATGTSIPNAIFGGELYKNALVNYDAAAKTAMDAREITDASSTTIVKF